jgi:phage-related protein
MTIFTWSPDPGATGPKTPRVKVAPYGDGYEQRVGEGINRIVRTWSLTFTRPTAEIDAIDAFLEARAGAESFDWTPPRGPAGKWKCASWSVSVPALSVQSLTATFTEVFGD